MNLPSGTIDVWWRGKQDRGLMLLLTQLLHQNPEWRRSPIRMLRVLSNEEAPDEVTRILVDVCAAARITAQAVVVVRDRPAPRIQGTSANAAIVILGFEPALEGSGVGVFQRMEALAGRLPRAVRRQRRRGAGVATDRVTMRAEVLAATRDEVAGQELHDVRGPVAHLALPGAVRSLAAAAAGTRAVAVWADRTVVLRVGRWSWCSNSRIAR